MSAVSVRALGPTEWRRRLWHVAPGLLPLLLWLVPHRDPLGPAALVAIPAVALAVGGLIYARYRQIARPADGERLPATAGYALSVLVPILLFPGDIEIGLTVLAVLAFGDGSATAGGLLLGGSRLPWNSQKTWAGLACFLLVGVPAAALIHWGESAFNPHAIPASLPFGVSLVCGAAAALAGAAAESVRSPINDNARVGLAAGLAAGATHLWLV
jgi:dolichol kinase